VGLTVLQAAGSLVSIGVLLLAGVLMSRRGLLGERAVDGLKLLITTLTLPLLLFRAFLQLRPEGRNAVLALAVFAACAVMAGIGAALTRAVRLPRPETRLLFQGFEAGMLGYAFFVALHGNERLSSFAALDMGQVVYVFTVLMVQMSVLEQHRVREEAVVPASDGRTAGAAPIVFPWRDIVASKVLWAIFGGLAISLAAPGFAASLAGADGFAAPVFDTIGGLTTPLVCLVIGASLAGGIPRDPAIVKVVALRTVVGLALGLGFGLLVVPALGFSDWYAKAAIMLFVLPAPFVIPVYYRRSAAFIGSVLTLSTAVSIVLIAVLAVLGIA
jgi:predicted permease